MPVDHSHGRVRPADSGSVGLGEAGRRRGVNFTLGPWNLTSTIEHNMPYHAIVAGRGFYDEDAGGFYATFYGKVEDARLISAAPCMYEALRDAEKRLRTAGMLGDLDDPARAALAKAEGLE